MTTPKLWMLRAIAFCVAYPIWLVIKVVGESVVASVPSPNLDASRSFGVMLGRFVGSCVAPAARMVALPSIPAGLKQWIFVSVLFLVAAACGDWPYNFYILLRIVVTATLIFAVVRLHSERRNFWMAIVLAIAVLFNPVAPFRFAKSTWTELNWTAAVVLAILGFCSRKSEGVGGERR